jgi:hypothetical protein
MRAPSLAAHAANHGLSLQRVVQIGGAWADANRLAQALGITDVQHVVPADRAMIGAIAGIPGPDTGFGWPVSETQVSLTPVNGVAPVAVRPLDALLAHLPPAETVLVDLSADAIAGATRTLAESAVVVIDANDPDYAPLRARWFDAGFVEIDPGVLLQSNRWGAVAVPVANSGNAIAMPRIGEHGLLGNQVFRYAFLRLFAWKHGFGAQTGPWLGDTLFDLPQVPVRGPHLDRYLQGDDRRELGLWREHFAPNFIAHHGYYQEQPDWMGRHRRLWQRLFRLKPELEATLAPHIDAARGDGTLVTIHVRLYLQGSTTEPAFFAIPGRWYYDWLERIWPTLDRPRLYIATEAPEAVLPMFARFQPLALAPPPGAYPPDFFDWVMINRSDVVAFGNSSFSRSAVLVADDRQRRFIADPGVKAVVPYEPWADRWYWQRYLDWDGKRGLDGFLS